MASNDTPRRPDMEALAQVADTRCVQAAAFAVKVPGERPEEKLGHLLGLFADAVLEGLGRLGKRQIRELRDFITDDIEAPYSVSNEGPTKTVGTPSSRYVLARRAASTIPGEALRAAVSVDVPWDDEGNLRYRAEMSVGWLASGNGPFTDDDGSSTLVNTRSYVWDVRSAQPPAQDLFLETPMHRLHDLLQEEGAVVAVEEAEEERSDDKRPNDKFPNDKFPGDKRSDDLRIEGAERLGGVETALSHLSDDERRAVVEAALAALDGGEGADAALGALWRAVMAPVPETLWWPSRNAAELQMCRDAVAAKPESVEGGSPEAEGSGEELARVLEKVRKEAADARARLAKAQEDHGAAESRLMDQLKEARAEAASLRREVDGARATAAEAEKALRDAKEAQEVAEGRERAAEEAMKELDRVSSERDNEVRRLEAQVGSLEEAARDTALASWGETSMPVSEMFSVPRNLDEVLALAQQAWPERLLVLPSAHKAAKAWSGRDLDRPWRALCAVAEVLWSLHFAERLPDEQDAFADRTGFTLTLNESKTVCEVPVFREARTFVWDGERVFMPAHVVVGNGSAETSVRMHFAYDEDNKRVVIGHLGKHLPNTMS